MNNLWIISSERRRQGVADLVLNGQIVICHLNKDEIKFSTCDDKIEIPEISVGKLSLFEINSQFGQKDEFH